MDCDYDPPRLPGTVSTLQLLAMLEALHANGSDAGAVLSHAGLDRASLEESGARVSTRDEFRLWHAAVEVTGDPLLGIHLAEVYRFGGMGAFEYLLLNSSTAREAAERAKEFIRVIDDLTQLTLREGPQTTALEFTRAGGHPFVAHDLECLFACFVRVFREEGIGEPVAVHFTHSAHGPAEEYYRALGVTPRFNCEVAAMICPTSMLDRPIGRADPKLGAVLEEHVRCLLEALPEAPSLSRDVARVLTPLLPQGEPFLPGVAHALHVSPRTLRRKLNDEGVNFRGVLEGVRRDLAVRSVADAEVPLKRLAERLGFSEQATFTRAFKRWTGTTPAAYRDRGAEVDT